MTRARVVFQFALVILAIWHPPVALATPVATDPMKQGLRTFQQGQFAQAIRHWQRAVDLSAERQQPRAQSQALTHLAQAYQALGHYKKSQASLNQALVLAQQVKDRSQVAAIIGSLCNVYGVITPPPDAKPPLQSAEQCWLYTSSLAIELGLTALAATVTNNLGNWWFSQDQALKALDAYTDSAKLAQQAQRLDLIAQAQTNAAMAATQTARYAQAKALLDTAYRYLAPLPATHQKANYLNKMGRSYHTLCKQVQPCPEDLLLRASDALTMAADVAQAFDDHRALSYAWGYLGHLYETQQHETEALDLTRRAITAAQTLYAPESLYRWQWQAGRLLHTQNDVAAALLSYRHAIATLQGIRPELSHRYGHPPASFRNSTGRLYFEFVDLLLQRAAAVPNLHDAQPYLHEARNTVELFKADELRDYFRDDCVDAAQANPTPLDHFTDHAVIIYPISLPDRLELLVSLPQGLKRYTVPVSAKRLQRVVRSFRKALQYGKVQRYTRHAQRLHTWLITPLISDLAASPIKTLVFVPDGALRLVPFSALHDGHRFLIQTYAIATTPALALTDPRPLHPQDIKVLTMGLTQSVQGFAALPYVSNEMSTIHKLYGGTQLLNETFLADRVEAALASRDFGIVHIASHGKFASDVSQSFILTFDDKLTMDRLETMIGRLRYRETPLELLTLSACETAVGDDRAALGLAGVAIKAGARSALATLWHVADEATAVLIAEFYRQLQQPGVSRAQALRQAQLKLLADDRYQSPYFWSPFLLINNWF